MKIIIQFFFIIFNCIILIFNRNYKLNLENRLIRYIKFNRKNITIGEQEEKLLSIINYVKSLKEERYKNISYNKIIEPKVSFISPVFNQQDYLASFITSIQKQKLKDYELIFIDDFSIDQSVQFIVDKKKDKRIKLKKIREHYIRDI